LFSGTLSQLEKKLVDTKTILENLINGVDLNYEEAEWVMNRFMDGDLAPSQMSAILVALRIKKETVTEIVACASVMRQKSTKIPITHDLIIDTCGTGGDSSGSFNISTTVALLLAGGGYKVAKHGNRSMTSKSGSADLLEAYGINLHLSPQQVSQCIQEIGIGFLFAPALHSAMKNVVPIRKELAVRTIFNILGPLTNPANAQVQIIGLFDSGFVAKIIRVLKELGSRSAFVFSGLSGLDEVCIENDTQVARLKPDGEISEFVFNPEEYGFEKASLADIRGGTPEMNAEITKGLLKGETLGPKRDIVILNAGFAIAAAENCSLEEGFASARKLLDQGVGTDVVEKMVALTNSFA
jgi:anthranilate phosphoribosyltransferase